MALVHMIFSPASAVFEAHRAALLADTSCQQALLNVLLHRVLPILATALEAARNGGGSSSGGGSSGGGRNMGGVNTIGDVFAVMGDSGSAVTVLDMLPALLIVTSGSEPDAAPSEALRSRICQPGGAALVHYAARIIRGLPLTRPASMQPGLFAQSHNSALQLLELTAGAMAYVPEGSAPPSACEQGGSSGGDGGSGSAAVVSASAEEQQEAAWHVVRLVPHLAELVRSLAADASFPGDRLASACTSFHTALHLLFELRIASREQLASYAAAADAALRLQPMLVALYASWRQQGWRVPADLSQMLQMLWCEGIRAVHAWQKEEASGVGHRGPPPVPAPLARNMWQLHSTSCRFVHWLDATAGDSRCLPAGPRWPALLDALCGHYEAAGHFLAHCAALDEGSTGGAEASGR